MPTQGNPPLSNAVLSNYISTLDLLMPDKLAKVFNSKNLPLTEWLKWRLMCGERQVASDTYSHYEGDKIHIPIKVAGFTGGGVGNAVTITVASSEQILNTDGTWQGDIYNLYDANGEMYIRVQDIIENKYGVQGLVVAVDKTNHKATIRPISSTEDLSANNALSAGKYIKIISGAAGEKTGQPEGARSGFREYFNDLQIVKETFEISGGAKADRLWIEQLEDGTPINSWYFKEQFDQDYRMALKMDGAFRFGQRTDQTNPVRDIDGNIVRTTEGIYTSIKNRGTTLASSLFLTGTADVAFDTMSRILTYNNVSSPFVYMSLGIRIYQAIENAMKIYLDNNGTDYTSIINGVFNGLDVREVNMFFKYFVKTGRKYIFSLDNTLSNVDTYNTYGHEGENFAFVIPIQKNMSDPVTGTKLDNIMFVYKSHAGTNRKLKFWQDGANADIPIGALDTHLVYQLSHMGAEIVNADKCIAVSPFVP